MGCVLSIAVPAALQVPDKDANDNKRVAVKVQKLTPESESMILEEYRILRDYTSHPNLPDFYGIYRRRSGKKTEYDQIWFVMELCDGGTVMDLVHGLLAMNKKMREEHIGFILREVIQAMIYLNENNVMHRDIRGSNILLTKEGEIKLVDFGLSRTCQAEIGKRYTCVGSPSWMAPEVAISKGNNSEGYGNRADVWAIGITAIELADGKPPFQDMHPTRALFQIIRNPPPTLNRPSNWSQNFNDFISECLEKNPENRPFMGEIIEHPFLAELPDNDFLLTKEIKILMMDACEKGKQERKLEILVRKGFLKTHQTDPLEPMFMEDLAALETLTEDAILDELHERLRQGYYHSFIGDILLILNPNEQQDIYGSDFHTKYQFKSRSDNAPHIYSVADSAYQDVMHNNEAQHILLAGESNSGKTTNMMHLIRHLMYLGKSLQDIGGRFIKAIKMIQAFSNAATPLNPNSTRCLLQVQTTYGTSGKASGGIFWLYQLEKWRVSTRDRNQSNFHVLYYFYDGMDAVNKLKHYHLPPGRRMRYLRISEKGTERKRSFKVRNDPRGNVAKFEELKEDLKILEMEEHCEMIWKVLAAILILGEIRFIEDNNGEADMDNNDAANKVAELLNLDEKKFSWALLNYCMIVNGNAVRKRHTYEEAKEARDVLANTIYQRLVDWMVNTINVKFTLTRSLFGDKYAINVMDLFGFECFAVNRLEQLVVNTMNEQMQCYYNQRVFAWEMQEQEEEAIPMQRLHFYDNKNAIDNLMGKDRGLFSIIDEASKNMLDYTHVISKIQNRAGNVYVKVVSSHEFTVAHYTGKLVYDASEIAEKNRDFLPPEMIETLRQSAIGAVKEMFTNKLTKSGNLTIIDEHSKIEEKKTNKGKWGALMQESKLRRFNTTSRGQFSQIRKMRTCAATFKSTSLEILKNLSIGGGSGGMHFIRCIRSDLEGTPRGFYREVVRQQIRALAVLDTAKARQYGYPHRISFPEFIRRYQFLAFDFDETVEINKDNCRLLLIRLKLEGWIIGKTKVFLKYYNEEYLSRLYETQVKKIIKVQCMMRSFLARKNMASKITSNIKKEPGSKRKIRYRDCLSFFSERIYSPSKIALHFSDVEVQTTNSPHRVHSNTEGQDLIDTPFSRDPNVSIRCPPDALSQARMDDSGYQYASRSITPVPPANAHNPRSNYDNIGSIRSRKHAPPPPVPFNQPHQPPLIRSSDNYSSNIRSKSNVDTATYNWEYENKTSKSSGNPNRINPIQELQMIGRRDNYDGNEDSDEPPFNFQAMLRKTPYRASLKRPSVFESHSHSPSPLPTTGYRGNRESESNVVYKSGGSRRDSLEWSPNEMVRMSEKYGKEGAWGEDRSGVGGRGNVSSESVTAEIAPGIVIEGYVAEL
ncbi:neither inactivation nor afterpotential protein C [Apis florea]|uniref:neither inactivation nor afterpotential protein C n=1 Tax=Apis florea TaxID=7463 RepID=UPI0012FE8F29|nr:neither inactivation nor afterpotential protein C [Apis florea]